MVPPILLLLSSKLVMAVKFPKLPNCPPKFAAFMVIPVMEEPVHTTPCQLSPHGSPPFAVHPGRSGDPSEMYSPFMAETSVASVTARTSLGAAANATSSASSRSGPRRSGARCMTSIPIPDGVDHTIRRRAPPVGSRPAPRSEQWGREAAARKSGRKRRGGDRGDGWGTGLGLGVWDEQRRNWQGK